MPKISQGTEVTSVTSVDFSLRGLPGGGQAPLYGACPWREAEIGPRKPVARGRRLFTWRLPLVGQRQAR